MEFVRIIYPSGCFQLQTCWLVKRSINANCNLLRWPSGVVFALNGTSMQGLVLWIQYLPTAGDCDEAQLLQQTDHFTAFASVRYQLIPPCMRHFYMHHLIRCLEGDEANDTFLILQRQKHKFKRLHNLCQATQLVSVRVRIRVSIRIPWTVVSSLCRNAFLYAY